MTSTKSFGWKGHVTFAPLANSPTSLLFYREYSLSMDSSSSTKNSEDFETGTNYTKISGEDSRKSGKCWIFRIANHSTENSRNLRKVDETVMPGKKFRKWRYSSQSCPLFQKFGKIPFHSSLEISGNSNRNFSSDGRRPVFREKIVFCTIVNRRKRLWNTLRKTLHLEQSFVLCSRTKFWLNTV